LRSNVLKDGYYSLVLNTQNESNNSSINSMRGIVPYKEVVKVHNDSVSQLKNIMEEINAEKLKRITLENEFTLAKMRKLEELKKFNSIRREQIENVDAEQR